MGMPFLPPDQPLSTCIRGSCDGCEVRGRIVCHFDARKLAGFYALAAPALLVGIVGMATISWCALIGWVFLYIIALVVLGVRSTCTHCPHYAEPGLKGLRCWINYGYPKLWAYRPGPLVGWEKTAHFGVFGLVFLYPVPFLLQHGLRIGGAWTVIFLALAAGFLLGLRRWYCARCMNLACPFNTVDDATRAVFRRYNPSTCGCGDGTGGA